MDIKLIVNKFLHLFELRRINSNEKCVYLTFDDGPEGEITDWVLNVLERYGAKATFFCKGENAVNNKAQLTRIVEKGHALGNHTYSHINSLNTPTADYVKDVDLADGVLNTVFFRPPWGSLTFSAFLQLRKKYKIVYWSLISGDTFMEKLDLDSNMQRLYRETRPGDIVLFHSCVRHENETKQILPLYLEWLSKNGFKTSVLE